MLRKMLTGVVPLMLGVAGVLAQNLSVDQLQADSSDSMLPDDGRLLPGIYVAGGVLVEGVSLATETAIPYLGVGHFLQKDWLSGSLFLGSELGVVLMERRLRDRAGPNDWSQYPPINSTELYSKTGGRSSSSAALVQYADLARHTGFYLRLIDFYSAYRGFHAATAATNAVRPRDESIPDLMVSPFKLRHLTNPWVYAPVALTAIITYFDSQNSKPISSTRDIEMFNSRFSPTGAALVHSGVDAYRYLLVAAGEEMFFRGALQTELEERTGRTGGLVFSSLLFGLAHLPNKNVLGALGATVGGFYFGYRYQASGYDLGEVIATHFFLDFVPSVIEFIQNPRNGRFVYSIHWRL